MLSEVSYYIETETAVSLTSIVQHPLPAAANSMTLKQLLAKNPQIKDPGKMKKNKAIE